jgi:hypothetical protein
MWRLPNVVMYKCKGSDDVRWMRADAYASEDMDMVSVWDVDEVGGGSLVGGRRGMRLSSFWGLRACMMQVGGGPVHRGLRTVFVGELMFIILFIWKEQTE